MYAKWGMRRGFFLPAGQDINALAIDVCNIIIRELCADVELCQRYRPAP